MSGRLRREAGALVAKEQDQRKEQVQRKEQDQSKEQVQRRRFRDQLRVRLRQQPAQLTFERGRKKQAWRKLSGGESIHERRRTSAKSALTDGQTFSEKLSLLRFATAKGTFDFHRLCARDGSKNCRDPTATRRRKTFSCVGARSR